MVRLKEKCPVCGSMNWCGRNCAYAPAPATSVAAEPKRVMERRLIGAPSICPNCGTEFIGPANKAFCSTKCRVAAWRARQ